MNSNLVNAVKKYALEHYTEGGWDVIVETYEDDDIWAHISEATHTDADGNSTPITTEEEAINSFRTLVSIWADRQADARNSAF